MAEPPDPPDPGLEDRWILNVAPRGSYLCTVTSTGVHTTEDGARGNASKSLLARALEGFGIPDPAAPPVPRNTLPGDVDGVPGPDASLSANLTSGAAGLPRRRRVFLLLRTVRLKATPGTRP